MAYDETQIALPGIVMAARKGGFGNAINAAARRYRLQANQRFSNKLQAVEKALKEKGWSARCWSRPINENDSVYWPPKEIAILVGITDFETDMLYLEDCLAIGQQHPENDFRYRIVPVINGQVLAPLAMLPSSHIPLPDQDFAQDWQKHINQPFLSPGIAENFDEALAACTQVSAILACCELENLHPEEDKIFSKAIESFEHNHELVAEAAENTELEYLVWALDYLDENWNQVASEFEAAKAGKVTVEPLCMITHLALAEIGRAHV